MVVCTPTGAQIWVRRRECKGEIGEGGGEERDVGAQGTRFSLYWMQMRKHVRRRRVVAIQQLGLDRAICISFSGTDGGAHIICEMYATGNLILAAADYTILALQRPFRDDARGLVFLPQHPYPLHSLRSRPQLSESLDGLSSESSKSLRDKILATPLGGALGNTIVVDLVSR